MPSGVGPWTTLTGPEGRPGPELVGTAVADALEDPATPLRVEVGQDATMVLELRRTLARRRVRGHDARRAEAHLVMG